MNGHCDFHTFERAVDVCGLCYGDLCRNCALNMKGRRDAVCKDCALTVSGVRGAGKTEVRGDRSTVKKRRKAYAAAGPSDDYFKYFDEGRDDLEVTFGDERPSSDEPPPPAAETTSTSSPTDPAAVQERAKSDESGLRRFIGKRKPAAESTEEESVKDFIAIDEMLGGSDADGGGSSANDQDAVSQLADIRNRDRERDGDAGSDDGPQDLAETDDDNDRDQATETLPSPISKAEAWAAGFDDPDEEVDEQPEPENSSPPAPVESTDRVRPADSEPPTAMKTSTFDDRYDEELVDTSRDPFAANQPEPGVDRSSEPIESIPAAEPIPTAETSTPVEEGQPVADAAESAMLESSIPEPADTPAEVPAPVEDAEAPDSDRGDPELRKMADVSSAEEQMRSDDSTDSDYRSTDVFNFDVSPRLKGLADELAAKRDDGPVDNTDNPFARRAERQPETAAPDFSADPFAKPPEPEPVPLPKRQSTVDADSIEPEVEVEAVEIEEVAVEQVEPEYVPLEEVETEQVPVEEVAVEQVKVEEVAVEVEPSSMDDSQQAPDHDEATDEWGWVHDEPLETLVEDEAVPEYDEPVRSDAAPVPDGPDPVYSDDDHPSRRRDDETPAPTLSPEQFAKASQSEEMMATALGDTRDQPAEVDGEPPELGSTVMPTLEDESDGWIEVDDVPDLEGTTARERADVDARGSWIPPALRGVADDAAEAGQDLPRRRREGE